MPVAGIQSAIDGISSRRNHGLQTKEHMRTSEAERKDLVENIYHTLAYFMIFNFHKSDKMNFL